MDINAKFHNWKTRFQTFIQTPEGREWYWYGRWYAGFIAGLLLLLILMDTWVMPHYVGLDRVVSVPSVVGMNTSAARKMLEDKGLSVRVRNEYYNNNVPAGYITNQIPFPNTQVKPARTIYLDISKGKQLLEMPDLIGLTLRDAKLKFLQMNNGLELNRVSYNYNKNLPPDVIASQSISKGTKVAQGAQVDVVVSLGAEDAYSVVPLLIGKGVEEAKRLIATAGLTLGEVVTGEKNETMLPGTVINQIPPAKDSVRSGTPVTLTVSK